MTPTASRLLEDFCGDRNAARKHARTIATRVTRKWLKENPKVLKTNTRCEEAVFWFDVARELDWGNG